MRSPIGFVSAMRATSLSNRANSSGSCRIGSYDGESPFQYGEADMWSSCDQLKRPAHKDSDAPVLSSVVGRFSISMSYLGDFYLFAIA